MKFWLLFLSACSLCVLISAPIVAFNPSNGKSVVNSKKDISQKDLNYSVTVNYLNDINSQEVNEMTQFNSSKKTDITSVIEQEMALWYNAQLNIDYNIINLNEVVVGANLNNVGITIDSLNSSTKITGNTNLVFHVKENINDRKFSPPVSVPNIKLDSFQVIMIDNYIKMETNQIVATNQQNILGKDYNIEGINLITEGSTYNDFANSVYVVATATSTTLIGQFKVDFQLQN